MVHKKQKNEAPNLELKVKNMISKMILIMIQEFVRNNLWFNANPLIFNMGSAYIFFVYFTGYNLQQRDPRFEQEEYAMLMLLEGVWMWFFKMILSYYRFCRICNMKTITENSFHKLQWQQMHSESLWSHSTSLPIVRHSPLQEPHY